MIKIIKNKQKFKKWFKPFIWNFILKEKCQNLISKCGKNMTSFRNISI